MLNQPIEEKWKIDLSMLAIKYGTGTEIRGRCEIYEIKELTAFIENLLEQERNHYEKELKIADERWKRAEANHREKHESETEICVYH